MKRFKLMILLTVAACTSGLTVPAQQRDDGVKAQVGQIFDEIGEGLQDAWAQAQRTVDQLGVQGRVYGRLHWDEDLHHATLDIDVADGVVTLNGSVATTAVKKKAVRLTEDTVGVRRVVDRLAVLEKSEK